MRHSNNSRMKRNQLVHMNWVSRDAGWCSTSFTWCTRFFFFSLSLCVSCADGFHLMNDEKLIKLKCIGPLQSSRCVRFHWCFDAVVRTNISIEIGKDKSHSTLCAAKLLVSHCLNRFQCCKCLHFKSNTEKNKLRHLLVVVSCYFLLL